MRYYQKKISTVGLIFFTLSIFNLPAHTAIYEYFIPNVLTLSAGPGWVSPGEQQLFDLTPSILKFYTVEKTHHNLPVGEIFLGRQNCLIQDLYGQFGLGLSMTGNARIAGQIWDDADPEFNNYAYTYQIQHAQVALKGKLLIDDVFWFTPWISGTAALGFNRAHAYNNVPLIFEAVRMPNFRSKTKTVFSYAVGAGLQIDLNRCLQLGVGYEFSDWGKSLLGPSIGLNSRSRLGVNHVYMNALMFNITFLS